MGSGCVRAARPAVSMVCIVRVSSRVTLSMAVNFSGPPCPSVRQRGVLLGAVQGIVDGCPLRDGVNGNVGVLCRVYPDSFCGSRLGRLVVVSWGCAFNGGRALGGYEKVHGLC